MNCKWFSKYVFLVTELVLQTSWIHGMSRPRNKVRSVDASFDSEISSNNCGGFETQWIVNDGRCGVCGAAWNISSDLNDQDLPSSDTLIVDVIGDTINAFIQLQSETTGWMEFRIYDRNATNIDEKGVYLLEIGGTSNSKYWPRGTGFHIIPLKIPGHVNCSECDLQLKYHTGRYWGCDGERCCIGCGRMQEEFYACASVQVPRDRRNETSDGNKTEYSRSSVNKKNGNDSHVTSNSSCPMTQFTNWWCQTQCRKHDCQEGLCKCVLDSHRKEDLNHILHRHKREVCHAYGVWAYSPGINSWCATNCARGYCPDAYCTCDASDTPSTQLPTTTTTATTTPTTTTTTTTTPRPTTTTTKPDDPELDDKFLDYMKTAACEYCFDKYDVNCMIEHCISSPNVYSMDLKGNPMLQMIHLAEKFCGVCDMIKNDLCKQLFCLPNRKILPMAAQTTCDICREVNDVTCIQKFCPALLADVRYLISHEAGGDDDTIKCAAIGDWKDVPYFDDWCSFNCAAGNCPELYCNCSMSRATPTPVFLETDNITCKGAGQWTGQDSMDIWCEQNCWLGNCPTVVCICKEKTTTSTTTTTTTTSTTTTTMASTPTTTKAPQVGVDKQSLNVVNALICHNCIYADPHDIEDCEGQYCGLYNSELADPEDSNDRILRFSSEMFCTMGKRTNDKTMKDIFCGGVSSVLAQKTVSALCAICLDSASYGANPSSCYSFCRRK